MTPTGGAYRLLCTTGKLLWRVGWSIYCIPSSFSSHSKKIKTRMVLKHPPPNFQAPNPAKPVRNTPMLVLLVSFLRFHASAVE
jgi:hypothetical protein